MSRICVGISSAALVATALGCAPRPSRLQTSDAPPKTLEPEPLLTYSPPVSHVPVSHAELHRASKEFFLALETQASARLDQLLTKDALVRRQTTGAAAPALAGLLEISEAWSASSAGSATPARSLFGPVTILETHTDPTPSWVTAEVARPTDVQGLWTLRFNDNGQEPLIQEVVLPPSR